MKTLQDAVDLVLNELAAMADEGDPFSGLAHGIFLTVNVACNRRSKEDGETLWVVEEEAGQ